MSPTPPLTHPSHRSITSPLIVAHRFIAPSRRRIVKSLTMSRTTQLRTITFGLFAAALALTAAPARAGDGDAAASVDSDARSGEPIESAEVMRIIQRMEAAYARVDDYTAVFIKQERVKDKLVPRETMELKFRKPFAAYLKWTGGKKEGQEVIYVRGWNNGKIRAHQGRFPDITVDLEPENSLAMRGNRHPITDLGIGNTIDLIARDARLASARPVDNVEAYDLGVSTIHGARARCVEVFTPDRRWSGYYAYHARFCVDQSTSLPIRVTVWGRDGELLEDYTYAKVKLNVGLTDQDFSPDNPAYGF
jgi:outer membrane lipoprotein-sorting protein